MRRAVVPLFALLLLVPALGGVTMSQSSPSDALARRIAAFTSTVHVDIATDNETGLYDAGAPVTFIVHIRLGLDAADNMPVSWRLTDDRGLALSTGTDVTKEGEVRVTGQLDEPGFLHLHVTVTGPAGAVNAQGAAGVAVHAIQPSRPRPNDFDAFWDEKKAALAAVPPTANVTPVTSSYSQLETFDVQVDSLGSPVSGYMARPKSAAPGTLPAIITLHGAGVGTAHLTSVTSWALEGMLAMDINAHGIPNGRPEDFYTQLAAGELADYRVRGRTDRDNFYFLGMFLRVLRAIDFITAQPEWDGKTLILYGTSQGGAQSIAGAALDERVSFFVAGVPAMADLTGTAAGKPMGWPNMAADLARMSAATRETVWSTLSYFDGANFLAGTKAPGFFTVGFLDNVCPPTTVYAAYNMMHTEKDIFNDLQAVHENTPEAIRRMREAVLTHAAGMRDM